MATHTGTRTPPAHLPVIGAPYPIEVLTRDPGVEDWIVRLVWISLPLEYFLLTTLPGGAARTEFLPVLLLLSATLLAVFGASFALAFLSFSDADSFSKRFRRWAVALAVSLFAALLVMTASRLISNPLLPLVGETSSISRDLPMAIICGNQCPSFPKFDVRTFGVYSFYSIVATFLVLIVARMFKRANDPRDLDARSPNAIVVTALTAVILFCIFVQGNSLP